LPRGIENLAGNAVRNVEVVLENINPLKYILPKQISKTTTTLAKVATDVAADVLDGTKSLFTSEKKGFSGIGADSFQGETIITTNPKLTTPESKDPFGNLLLHGAQNMLDSLLGKKTETTVVTQTKATVALPAGGHGRGVPAILFHVQNILQSALKVVGAILHWTQHPEPAYILSKIDGSLQSVEALKDIYLQRNMEGGIGDIPKHVEAILKNIGSLADAAKSNNPAKMIQAFFIGKALFENVQKLEGDFIESPITTAAPGGIIGNILQGIGLLGNMQERLDNQNTPTRSDNTSLQQRYGEFGNVVQNTGKLVDVLGDIEEALQDRVPNSVLLKVVGKLKESVQLSLTNNTLDNENILDVIQKVWFPNSNLAQIIGNFGKILTQIFPNSDTAQDIGNILQQEMLVNLGLNIVIRSSSFLRFGNIKDFLLQAVGNVENEIVGDDLNRLIAGGIGASETIIETFERFLKAIIGI
jgi:hypothetical protein